MLNNLDVDDSEWKTYEAEADPGFDHRSTLNIQFSARRLINLTIFFCNIRTTVIPYLIGMYLSPHTRL